MIFKIYVAQFNSRFSFGKLSIQGLKDDLVIDLGSKRQNVDHGP